MDAEPVRSEPSWGLIGQHAAEAQGLVVSPMAHLPAAEALFIRLPDGVPGGAWLAALRELEPITAATGRTSPAAAIALTAAGLRATGLPEAVFATLNAPFVEGMHQRDRRRRLGDRPEDGGLIEGGARWGGTVAEGEGEAPPETVHAMLLLYDETAGQVDARADAVVALLAEHDATVRRMELEFAPDPDGRRREHFGFADGFSQPLPKGEAVERRHVSAAADRLHGVPLGEFLIGHRNAHAEVTPGPIVECATGDAAARVLPDGTAPEGYRDMGRNGSYMVVRELRQDVAAFWNSMRTAAAELGDAARDADWLAARVIGRERDGDLLLPDGTLPAGPNGPANDFDFLGGDPHGHGCPIGSHVRRANPRDGLAPAPGEAETLLSAANGHRLLRRARRYGPKIEDRFTNDGVERGLLFMVLNTDLARQFEFVQTTWLLNPSFACLRGERDPLMAPRGPFTLPAEPVRRRATVETFVRMVGGEYFFLPSLPALAYLAVLPAR